MEKLDKLTFAIVHNQPWVFGTPRFAYNMDTLVGEDTDIYLFGVEQVLDVYSFKRLHPDAIILYPEQEIIYQKLSDSYSYAQSAAGLSTVSDVIDQILYVGTQVGSDNIRQKYQEIKDTYFNS